MPRHTREEALLEAGLATSLGVLLVGAGVLLLARILGGARRGRREREPAPVEGSIPERRHQHTAVVAAR